MQQLLGRQRPVSSLKYSSYSIIILLLYWLQHYGMQYYIIYCYIFAVYVRLYDLCDSENKLTI